MIEPMRKARRAVIGMIAGLILLGMLEGVQIGLTLLLLVQR